MHPKSQSKNRRCSRQGLPTLYLRGKYNKTTHTSHLHALRDLTSRAIYEQLRALRAVNKLRERFTSSASGRQALQAIDKLREPSTSFASRRQAQRAGKVDREPSTCSVSCLQALPAVLERIRAQRAADELASCRSHLRNRVLREPCEPLRATRAKGRFLGYRASDKRRSATRAAVSRREPSADRTQQSRQQSMVQSTQQSTRPYRRGDISMTDLKIL